MGIRRANNPNCDEHAEFVTTTLTEWAEQLAMRQLTPAEEAREVLSILALTVAVQEATGKLRLCINGRPLTDAKKPASEHVVPKQRFKLEQVWQAASMMRPGDWMVTTDFKSGFLGIPLQYYFRKLLCVKWQGKTYQCQALPFGLSSVPRVYTKVMRALLRMWRARGWRCSNFYDDCIFFARSYEEACALRDQLLKDLEELGWWISPAKCMLEPGQLVEYLGFEFCSLPKPHLRVPVTKVERAREGARSILRRTAEGAAAGPEEVEAAAAAAEAVGGGGNDAVSLKGRTLMRLLGLVQSLFPLCDSGGGHVHAAAIQGA